MIKEGVCKYCSEHLRANGSDNFRDLVNNHFKIKHNKEFKELLELREKAQKEFEQIIEKYPELCFGFSYFDFNLNNLLSKPQTIV